MMMDWNAYRQHLTVRVSELAKLSPDTVRGYQALSAVGQKSNLLGAKTRELISLAVAVAVRCDGCITIHARGAVSHGATLEEITEAVGVATAINAGAGIVYTARVCRWSQAFLPRRPRPQSGGFRASRRMIDIRPVPRKPH